MRKPKKSKKKAAVDFRYDTGNAYVSWAAVGENIMGQEAEEIIRFLYQPAKENEKKYQRQFRQVVQELDKLIQLSRPAGKLTLGSKVRQLEEKVAKYLKVKYACFMTNATSCFEVAYKFAGLKAGDEVIAPAITFISTISYPLTIGAKVVLADVDRQTLNIDPQDVARKITPRTKVIIPVHLGGYPADMASIMRLARQHNITVIEDGAHGFGGQYAGKKLGTIGHFGAYSFHEVKNITAMGEGGMLVSNTAYGKDFAKARFVGLDMSRKIPNWLYDVCTLKSKDGCFATGNYSATEVQALCLISQINRLEKIIAQRRKATTYLTRRFEKVEGIIPQKLGDKKHKSTYHLYLLQIDPEKVGGDIQLLKKKLAAKGVVQIPHFAPLYKFSIMRQLGYDTKAIERGCPVAEEAFNRRFTHLPLYNFNDEQISYMAQAVIEAVEEMKRR